MADLNLFNPSASSSTYKLDIICDAENTMPLCHRPWRAKFGGFRVWTIATDQFTMVFVPVDLGEKDIELVQGASVDQLRDIIANVFILTEAEGKEIRLMELRRACQSAIEQGETDITWGDGRFDAARILDALRAIDEPDWAIVNVLDFAGRDAKGIVQPGHVMLIRVSDTDERVMIMSHAKGTK